MLRNLQGLRAYAAISVALFHFSLVPSSAMPWHYGSFGVDLFFVLSGFIIAYSADRDDRYFLPHRLIRVLPTYWIVTTLGAAICLLGMPLTGVAEWWGQSLLFLTSPQGRPPIIFVGWTLVYELAFYLLYATALAASRKRAPFIAMAALAVIAFVPGLIPAPTPAFTAVLRPWPLLIEFVYGIAIFLATQKIAQPNPSRRYLGAALAVTGLALLYVFDPQMLGKEGPAAQLLRIALFGLPAALVVLGLVLTEKAGWRVTSRLILAFGGASYAIYLLHPVAFFLVFNMKPGNFQSQATIFTILTVVTLALSLGFYYGIETPLLRTLRRWLTPEKA